MGYSNCNNSKGLSSFDYLPSRTLVIKVLEKYLYSSTYNISSSNYDTSV